jgi:hypothetical protein
MGMPWPGISALSQLRAVKVEVLGAAVRELLAITKARFGSDFDFTTIARVVEDWAGVEIRG